MIRLKKRLSTSSELSISSHQSLLFKVRESDGHLSSAWNPSNRHSNVDTAKFIEYPFLRFMSSVRSDNARTRCANQTFIVRNCVLEIRAENFCSPITLTKRPLRLFPAVHVGVLSNLSCIDTPDLIVLPEVVVLLFSSLVEWYWST